jgi:hypothetical protein
VVSPNLILDLAGWHRRLAEHFKRLAAERDSKWPVFALEHGLAPEEVTDLDQSIRLSLGGGRPTADYYLPWVVYAAEFGYEYEGYEYWKTFAEKTHGWEDCYNSRLFFRQSFERFARVYRGATPSGAWAAWFKIIAWPITHGIVPKDLQRHLVRLLYDERFEIPRYLSHGAIEDLGKHLHAASTAYSDRFRQFAANEQLIGQIAAALLVQDAGERALLEERTLSRIAADINRERAAAEWLHEARCTADRLRVRGFATPGTRTTPFETPTVPAAQDGSGNGDSRTRQIPPVSDMRLQLRPTAAGAWDLWIQVPDLSPLVAALPHLRDVLRGRGRLTGSSRPLPSSVFLYGGTQPFRIDSWPKSNAPFIEYDGASGDLRQVLDGLFCPPPGTAWLFKLDSDGQASYVKTQLVQPGASYLLLSSSEYAHPPAMLTKVALTCSGVAGLRFDVPIHVDDYWPTLLERLGLQVAKTLSVWPAGFPAAAWTGVGEAEWLVGEPIVLGIGLDHPIHGFEVSIGQRPAVRIPVEDLDARTVFLALDPLPLGRHTLTVHTIPKSGDADRITGVLSVLVRAPQSVRHGIAPKGMAARFIVDPPSPSLEAVWAGRCDVQLSGPHQHPARVRVALFERGAEAPLVEKRCELTLPVDADTWRLAFHRIREEVAVQSQYDRAYRCRIDFDLGVLGRHAIKADRAFRALRWVVKSVGGKLAVQLVDDTGATSARVEHYDPQTPDQPASLSYDEALEAIPVLPSGGLFSAESDGQCASMVVVPAPGKIKGFHALKVDARPKAVSPAPNDLCNRLATARLWEDANTAGSALSRVYREQALTALLRSVVAALCGDGWGRLEAAVDTGVANGEYALAAMRQQVAAEAPPQMRAWLLRCGEQVVDLTLGERVQLFCDHMLAAYPHIEPSMALKGTSHLSASDTSPQARRERALMLYEFALRATSSASATLGWAGTHAKTGLRLLLDNPAVARAARLYVLITHRQLLRQGVLTTRLHAGWDWPCE